MSGKYSRNCYNIYISWSTGMVFITTTSRIIIFEDNPNAACIGSFLSVEIDRLFWREHHFNLKKNSSVLRSNLSNLSC